MCAGMKYSFTQLYRRKLKISNTNKNKQYSLCFVDIYQSPLQSESYNHSITAEVLRVRENLWNNGVEKV